VKILKFCGLDLKLDQQKKQSAVTCRITIIFNAMSSASNQINTSKRFKKKTKQNIPVKEMLYFVPKKEEEMVTKSNLVQQ